MAGKETILFSESAIARRVEQLADEIVSSPQRPEIALPILTGAFVFAADLLRALAARKLALPIEFIWLRAYGKAEYLSDVKVLGGPG